MDLTRLTIENFCGYKYTDLDLSSIESAVVIGKFTDNDMYSNGAGKSTLTKAIIFCLFGEYDTKTIDSIVRIGTDKAQVTLEFIVDDIKYKIERTRSKKSKKTDLRLWKLIGDKFEDITSKTPSELDIEVNKLIKITYKAFKNSISFSQNDIEGLASQDAKTRQNILKEALNASIYSKYHKSAKENESALNKEISEKANKIKALGDPNKDLENLINSLENLNQELINCNNKKTETEDKIRSKKQDVLDLDKLITSDQISIKDKLLEIINNKNNLLKIINNQEINFKTKSENLIRKKSENEKIKSSLDSLKQDLLKLKETNLRDVEDVKKELEKYKQEEPKGRAYILSLENKIKELNTPFPDGDTCFSCRQELTEEHKKNCLEEISKDIESKTKELELSKKKLNLLKNKKQEAELELNRINEIKNKIHLSEVQIESKEKEIKNNLDIITQHEELINTLNQEINDNKKELEKIIVSENQTKEVVESLNLTETTNKIISIKKEISSLENYDKEIIQNISNTSKNIGITSEKINNKKLEIESLKVSNAELIKLESELEIKKIISYSFSPAGIPTNIIYSILDDLQLETNKILSFLKPGLEIQFKITKENGKGEQEDTLDITYRLNAKELEYEQLSGGQHHLVALALRIGLSLVIQQRVGVQIKFLMLDEVDRQLDKAASQSFIELIKLLKDRFKIFLITHNDALKEKFRTAILVEGDFDNGSTAKVVNSW
jgi:DNA repair exonuclease SbcCD ATPase subunit